MTIKNLSKFALRFCLLIILRQFSACTSHIALLLLSHAVHFPTWLWTVSFVCQTVVSVDSCNKITHSKCSSRILPFPTQRWSLISLSSNLVWDLLVCSVRDNVWYAAMECSVRDNVWLLRLDPQSVQLLPC